MLLAAAALAPLGIAVFLTTSGFFAAWDGHAVSVAPERNASEVQRFTVRVVDADGALRSVWWPREAIEATKLPVTAIAIAPDPLPADAPGTRKSRFSLQFDVNVGGEPPRWVSLPTAAPRDLGLGVLVWILAIGLRNMIVARSPFALTRSDAAANHGAEAAAVLPFRKQPPVASGPRPKPGPPPKRGRR